MKKKLIHFTDQQIKNIQKDADKQETSFTEMIRRILDQYYTSRSTSSFNTASVIFCDSSNFLFKTGPNGVYTQSNNSFHSLEKKDGTSFFN